MLQHLIATHKFPIKIRVLLSALIPRRGDCREHSMTMVTNQANTVRDDFHLYLPTPGKLKFTDCQKVC